MFFQAQLEAAEARISELEQLGVPGEEFERLESELKKWKREAREKIKSQADLMDEVDRLKLQLQIGKLEETQALVQGQEERRRSKSRDRLA